MSDEQHIWERQDDEPNDWYDRFLIFLRMGPSRTKLGAVHLFELAEKNREKQSSKVPGSWNDAIAKWNWVQRAEAYDEHRRKQVFTQGNAYDLHRIERLDKLAAMLEERVTTMISQLPEKPKKKWFNHFMYQAYLDTQEALAQETGGRVKKTETTVKSLPKVYIDLDQDEDGSDA